MGEVSPVTFDAEANHRIYNSLALVAGLLKMQANELGGRQGPLVPVDEVRAIIADAAGRIETVARLHRVLANAHATQDICLDGYIRDVTKSVIASVSRANNINVSFRFAVSDALPERQVLPVGLIVGELVSNAIKYAHPAGLPTALTIAARQTTDRTVIEVADDGVGLPEGFDPATTPGLGFRILRALAAQISAETGFHSTPLGLRVRLTIPR
jgi:two-component sensor histidine kinase